MAAVKATAAQRVFACIGVSSVLLYGSRAMPPRNEAAGVVTLRSQAYPVGQQGQWAAPGLRRMSASKRGAARSLIFRTSEPIWRTSSGVGDAAFQNDPSARRKAKGRRR